ncbi:MAG: DUF2520 domain-containing protein [Bacteroidia bacterium]|nr:DUF2520 domain-containing protein [Bacteroidia bacterium]MDW8157896.1 DUF2520 domain-containing protein [Bacteroidia bacterium]
MYLQNKRCVIIGAGALGTQLALALQERGFTVVQVISRRMSSAIQLAQLLGKDVGYTDRLLSITQAADFVFFCVRDVQLPQVVKTLAPYASTRICYIHLAGSIPLKVLEPLGKKVGIIYPLYTFSPNRKPNWKKIPLFLEATSASREVIRAIAQALSPKQYWLTTQERLQLHLAAVFLANFTNYLAACAEEIIKPLSQKGVDLQVFFPIVQEVIAKWKDMSPYEAQTGPARRGDYATLFKHRELLVRQFPQFQKIYRLISEELLKKYGHPLPNTTNTTIEKAQE